MGTRSLTIVQDEHGKDICVLYRQMDGYPSGHGEELKQFLSGKRLCNGITMGRDNARYFNGLGCLAASLVAHFKKGIGEFYLHAAGTRDCWEDYRYFVSPGEDGINLRCETSTARVLYDGPVEDFDTTERDEE